MRQFNCAVLERHAQLSGDFATEPFETAWASEAIFFIRTEEMVGDNPLLWARVQISADGINWIDEGTVFKAINMVGDYFLRVSHFGGWLRLAGEVQQADAKIQATIQLVLKE